MGRTQRGNGGTPDYLGDGANGTGGSASATGADATPGASGPIDPATVDGSSSGTGGGIGGGTGDDFDPAIHVGRDKRNADGSYTRKRGRKAGSRASTNPNKAAADLGTSVEALAKSLMIVHTGIATISGLPEMMIDKGESEMLAGAAANVLAQFDFAPDPKTQAIIGMIMACGAVYGPRVMVIRSRKAAEKAAAESGAGVAPVYGPGGEYAGTTTFHEQPAQPN